MVHTIIFLQTEAKATTRTFCDFESVEEAMAGLYAIYKDWKGSQDVKQANISEVLQLYGFLDRLFDASAFVYQQATKSYVPHPKSWLKENLYIYLNSKAFRSKNSEEKN